MRYASSRDIYDFFNSNLTYCVQSLAYPEYYFFLCHGALDKYYACLYTYEMDTKNTQTQTTICGA